MRKKEFTNKNVFCVLTKNSHFEILIKNLVTFTKQDRVKDEKL